MHGPTYMGNALACAAANASLDLFEREPRLAAGGGDIASRWRSELAPCRGLPGVKDVRVKGAIGVVELERIDDLDALRARFVEEGVFIRPFGSYHLSDADLHHRAARSVAADRRHREGCERGNCEGAPNEPAIRAICVGGRGAADVVRIARRRRIFRRGR